MVYSAIQISIKYLDFRITNSQAVIRVKDKPVDILVWSLVSDAVETVGFEDLLDIREIGANAFEGHQFLK
jgi:hypothetical protein